MLLLLSVSAEVCSVLTSSHPKDNMDLAFANVAGAFAAVIPAWVLALIVEFFKKRYYNRK